MNVNIGGGTALYLGNHQSARQIVGTLKLSSPTAAAVTTLQNAIDLSGADRTIYVDDNPNSTADYAVMSGHDYRRGRHHQNRRRIVESDRNEQL